MSIRDNFVTEQMEASANRAITKMVSNLLALESQNTLRLDFLCRMLISLYLAKCATKNRHLLEMHPFLSALRIAHAKHVTVIIIAVVMIL